MDSLMVLISFNRNEDKTGLSEHKYYHEKYCLLHVRWN